MEMMLKMRIGIIGAGRMGRIHAKNFQQYVPQAEVVAFSSRTESTCKKACAEIGIDRYYLDYHNLLECEDINAVVIATPVIMHHEMVLASAQHKKHILCEKPMAMNVAECVEMRQAARENDIVLLMGFVKQFHKDYLSMKHIVDNGEIGDIVMIRLSSRTPGTPKNEMFDISFSRGLLSELSSHDINLIRWFSGSEFQSVYTVVNNFRSLEQQVQYPDYYDNMVTMGTLKSGVQYIFDGAFSTQYGYESNIEILGTKGKIVVEESNKNKIISYTPNRYKKNEMFTSWSEVYKEAFIEEAKHFYACVFKKESMQVMPFDGQRVIEVIDSCYKSITEKQSILLP